MNVDPVTVEVIRNSFLSIARQMNNNLVRSAYTPIIYEMHDCSVGVFDRNGRLLGQSPGLPMFLGNLELGILSTIEMMGGTDGFHAGDVYMVNDIYTIEDDSSYSLVVDHGSQSPIEYTVRENFDPPTLIIQITNAKWERGDFTRKSAHSPLYQFDVNSLSNKKSRQKNSGIRVRMSFNNIPEYSVVESSSGDENSLIIKWNKKEKRERDIYLSTFRRLPDSKVSFNFKEAELLTVVRLMASQENLNLVLGGDLKGSVTLKLDDVTLETAMDAILHVNGYEWFLQENIIIIKPSSPESQLSGELDTQIYRLRFVHGAIITEALGEVLTDRGKVKSLSSSQSLDYEFEIDDIVMVTDIPSNFALIDRVVNTIDQEGAQINISVKFIETTLINSEDDSLYENRFEIINQILITWEARSRGDV